MVPGCYPWGRLRLALVVYGNAEKFRLQIEQSPAVLYTFVSEPITTLPFMYDETVSAVILLKSLNILSIVQ